MFADEARFGRMNRPRPCWAPDGTRPQVACQLVREYVYLYGAVSPKDGTCVYLIMPAPDTQCFQIFLETLAKKYPRQLILLFVDGAGNHQSDELEVPGNIMLHVLPPYSPELNIVERTVEGHSAFVRRISCRTHVAWSCRQRLVTFENTWEFLQHDAT
jgi:hypothetical protein